MLIDKDGEHLHVASLVHLKDRVIVGKVTEKEMATLCPHFDSGVLQYDSEKEMFRINDTHWNELCKGHPVAWIVFNPHLAELEPWLVPGEWVGKATWIEHNELHDWYRVDGTHNFIQATATDWNSWKTALFPLKTVKVEIDHDPSIPEELEVDYDLTLGYPVSVENVTPVTSGGEITITQDFSEFTEPKNPGVTMGELFRQSMDASREHSNKLEAIYGDAWRKVHTVIYLARRYRDMLAVDSRCDFDEHRFGQKTSRNHIRWMIQELHDNFEQSLSKKNRWLGFIQGLMIAYGYTTVDREREETRDQFNGD